MATLERKSIEIHTDYSLPRKEWARREQEQLAAAAAEARAKADGDLVGETVQWQRADGYAVYMVTSERPLRLAHVDICDGYTVERALIKGLTLGDVRAMVEAERRWREAVDATNDIYDHLVPGRIVHYHNAFGQFVRCEVVAAQEDIEDGVLNLEKGEICLKPVALVGNWREHDLQHDSYHVRRIREGGVFKPNGSNIYENSRATGARSHGDPSQMTPLVFVPEPPKPTSREIAAARLNAMARDVVGSSGESGSYFVTTDGETVAVLLNRGPATLDKVLRLAEELPGQVVVEDETGVVWENEAARRASEDLG